MSKLMQIIDVQAMLASKEFDLDSFMKTVVEQMESLTSATGAVIELIEGDDMVYKAASGSVAAHVGVRLKRAGSMSGLCVRDGDTKISVDTANDNRVDAAACIKVGAASMICVPLFQKGDIVGVLKVVSNRANAFTASDIQTLRLMGGVLGAALGQQLETQRRRELEDKLSHMADHDPLTGLANRTLFLDRLEQAMLRCVRNQTILALLYIDIDFFKSVNDNYGHQVGDALLCEFSKRLRGLIRESDSLARLGSDEFTLIAENLASKSDGELLAKNIIEAARKEFDFDGIKLSISTSIGIVICHAFSLNAVDLFRAADRELHQAKENGRNNFRILYLDLPPPSASGSQKKI